MANPSSARNDRWPDTRAMGFAVDVTRGGVLERYDKRLVFQKAIRGRPEIQRANSPRNFLREPY